MTRFSTTIVQTNNIFGKASENGVLTRQSCGALSEKQWFSDFNLTRQKNEFLRKYSEKTE